MRLTIQEAWLIVHEAAFVPTPGIAGGWLLQSSYSFPSPHT